MNSFTQATAAGWAGAACMHVQYMHVFVVFLCWHVHSGVHMCKWVHLFKVCTIDCLRLRERESEGSSMLLLVWRVFITLRGPDLIMHGYMAPQTFQCFTGREKKQHCKTKSRIGKVRQTFYLLDNSANNSPILIIYLPAESPIHLSLNLPIHASIYSLTSSSVWSLFLSHFASWWL